MTPTPSPDPIGSHVRARWRLAGIALLLVAAAIVLWRFTPLAAWADAQRVTGLLTDLRSSAWGSLAVIGLYLVGGLIAFPVTLLIAATALVFDPLPAVALSFIGVLANALLTYWVGAKLVRGTMHAAFGRTVQRVTAALTNRGVIAVAVIRTVPIAPFTFVNVAMGAVGVRLRDYLVGTALGVAPGVTAFSVFGHQLREIIERPTFTNVALLAAAVLAWIALSLLLQSWISKRNARPRREGG